MEEMSRVLDVTQKEKERIIERLDKLAREGDDVLAVKSHHGGLLCPGTTNDPGKINAMSDEIAGVTFYTNATQGKTETKDEKDIKLPENLRCVPYDPMKEDEHLPAIRQLISKDLSEPYSIYVYRYFLYDWPDLCFMTLDENGEVIGVIICKLEVHRGGPLRGYIAMLAVKTEHRGKRIASKLVRMAIEAMIAKDADEIALETEVDNVPSLKLYQRLGFLRTKLLHRYYLNGNSAFRLILYLKEGVASKATSGDGIWPEHQQSELLHEPPSA